MIGSSIKNIREHGPSVETLCMRQIHEPRLFVEDSCKKIRRSFLILINTGIYEG